MRTALISLIEVCSPRRTLTNHYLGEACHEKIVWKSFDAAGSQLRPLATQRTRELPVVSVLLVRRLGSDMTLDAIFTERV